MDNVLRADNTRACIAQCLARPQWRLSLQTHKITGIR
jgi:7-carboxy-7-deazaguanine synthase